MAKKEIEITVYGRVQGVGFRYFTEKLARSLGITGYVKNEMDGSVFIKAQGEEDQLFLFQERVKRGPRFSNVEKVNIEELGVKDLFLNFEVKF